MMDTPTREIYWNIQGHDLIYLFFGLAMAVFCYGLYRRIRLWKLGQPEDRSGHIIKRIWGVLKDALGQMSVMRETTPGIMHVMIFSGFVVLFIGTLLVFLQADFSIQILFGQFYLWFSLILDLFGLIFIFGILFALFRRYILRPDRLNIILDDAIILPLLLIIGVTGFLLEGLRIAVKDPQWAEWSPVGYWIAGWLNLEQAEGIHRILWWGHMALSLIFIAYIPFSKLFHVLMSPTNMYLKSFKPRGELSTIDIENSETFGVSDINEFTWKQLLDLDACTHCGRCQDQCPAYNSDKPLSPKKIILDLQRHLTKRGPELIRAKKAGTEPEPGVIAGNAVTEDEIWACTTCMACQEHCPVAIEHVQKIVDLRRSLVLMDSQFPQELNLVFKGLETNANPWNMGSASRADWLEGLNVPTAADKSDADYLWFVGCAGAFDDKARATSEAFARILNKAGVSYAVLGVDEQCCGDPARRSGNEYVFQMLAQANIEMFQAVKFKKIVTACPHCFNVLRNEYPQFGGRFEVIHHTELILELIRDGKLEIKSSGLTSASYHDSCYLGRYHDIYQAPRDIMKKITGGELKEMKRHHDKSFCCGGGGARFFMEETIGSRINHLRIQEAADAGIQCLSVACPFCLTMLQDAVKEKELDGSIKVKEIAQLVAERI
ncbi:(Fe-S)-binding protein [bacterium]|nr:(Fe-S)-binding protein [bacterium]